MPHGRRKIGLLTAEPDRLLVSLAAQSGLDFIVLDAEQTQLDPRRCAEIVQALAGTPTEVVVRVPDLAPSTLVTYANTGVDELLLPQLRRVKELEDAHSAVRYAPEGTRSRQVSPASRYGTDFVSAPRISVLIETVEALDEVETIARSGLVSCAWFGATDLADDLARYRPSEMRRLDELIDSAMAVLHSYDVPVGLPAKDAAHAVATFERGAEQCTVYWEKCLLEMLRGFAGARAGWEEAGGH